MVSGSRSGLAEKPGEEREGERIGERIRGPGESPGERKREDEITCVRTIPGPPPNDTWKPGLAIGVTDGGTF
jgi:hypothetical protein